MRSGLVIERQVVLQALLRSPDGLVGVQIHLLVFDAFPEAFHEYVVSPAPFAVHADLDAVVGQQPRKLLARKLVPVIGIEDFWRAIAVDGLLHRVQTEIGCQRIGEPPGQHPATRPVENRTQVHNAPAYRNIR